MLSAAPLVLLVASFFDGAGAWLAAGVAAASLPPAAMLLGLGGRPRAGAVAVILLLWVLVTGSLASVVLLAVWPPPAAGPLGLPWAAALALVGIGLVPLVLVAVGYAATFRRPPEGAGPSG